METARPSSLVLGPLVMVAAPSTDVHAKDSLVELRSLRLRGDLPATEHIAVDHRANHIDQLQHLVPSYLYDISMFIDHGYAIRGSLRTKLIPIGPENVQ